MGSGDEDVADPFQAIEGVMQVIQALVVALDLQGKLDTTEYARLLLELRQREESGPLAQAMLDRMLGMLVDEPEVLRRRAALTVVDATAPSEPPPGRGP